MYGNLTWLILFNIFLDFFFFSHSFFFLRILIDGDSEVSVVFVGWLLDDR